MNKLMFLICCVALTANAQTFSRSTAFRGAAVRQATGAGGGGGGSGLVSFVQDGAFVGDAEALTAIHKAFTNANVSGNTIVAVLSSSSDAVTPETATIADTQGNTYTAIAPVVRWASNNRMFYWWYANNVAAGANTVTATFSGARNFANLYVLELSGASDSAPLQEHVETAGYQGVQISGTINATAFGFLLGTSVDYIAGGTITPQSTWTTKQDWIFTIGDVATTTYSMISTNSAPTGNDWLNCVASFKP